MMSQDQSNNILIAIIHIILCLTILMLISGCSHPQNQVLELCKENQMDVDRRLYGDPYKNLNRQSCIQFYFAY